MHSPGASAGNFRHRCRPAHAVSRSSGPTRVGSPWAATNIASSRNPMPGRLVITSARGCRRSRTSIAASVALMRSSGIAQPVRRLGHQRGGDVLTGQPHRQGFRRGVGDQVRVAHADADAGERGDQQRGPGTADRFRPLAAGPQHCPAGGPRRSARCIRVRDGSLCAAGAAGGKTRVRPAPRSTRQRGIYSFPIRSSSGYRTRRPVHMRD